MECTVVTEGLLDQELLKRLLEPERRAGRARVVSAGGKSAAESLARTVLALDEKPVVLVVDADTRSKSAAREQQSYYEYSLGMAGPSARARVVMVRPDLADCLLEHPDVLAELFAVSRADLPKDRDRLDREASDLLVEVSERGNGRPVLAAVASGLTADHVAALRQCPAIQEIVQAIEELTSVPAATSA